VSRLKPHAAGPCCAAANVLFICRAKLFIRVFRGLIRRPRICRLRMPSSSGSRSSTSSKSSTLRSKNKTPLLAFGHHAWSWCCRSLRGGNRMLCPRRVRPSAGFSADRIAGWSVTLIGILSRQFLLAQRKSQVFMTGCKEPRTSWRRDLALWPAVLAVTNNRHVPRGRSTSRTSAMCCSTAARTLL